MNCKETQQLIITDYIDGEIDGREKARIEGHVAVCRECRKFYEGAKEVTTGLFNGLDRAEPAEHVWQNIKAEITAGHERRPAFIRGIFERLRYVFYIPRPAFAVATILTMLLIFGTVTRLVYNRAELQAPGTAAQIEYFDYVGRTADVQANGNGGFDTAVEQYFL